MKPRIAKKPISSATPHHKMSKNRRIASSAIAKFLGARLHGKDIPIGGATSLDSLRSNAVSFARAFDERHVRAINKAQDSLIICSTDYKGRLNSPHILSRNPQLDFIKAIDEFFAPARKIGISTSAVIDPAAKIGKQATVGHHAVIGPEVAIGDNCTIGDNVVIVGKVRIGKDCRIKTNAVIGEPGFGFEIDHHGVPRHFTHIGSIEIGDDVWIGAGSCIERAHISKTVIRDGVKIDDLVQVGHNCVIGRNTIVTSGTVLCGGVKIGSDAWIAPNTSVKEKIKIGTGAFVGLGSVVIRDVPASTVVAGNPARILKKK